MTQENANRMEPDLTDDMRLFPVQFISAEGSLLYDKDNKKYIDFFSAAGHLNYGHNNKTLQKKLANFIDLDSTASELSACRLTAKKALIETIERCLLKPRNWNYTLQFTGLTGTNAIEMALKLARQVTGRQNVISFTHGFQGLTDTSLINAINNTTFRSTELNLSNTTFMPYDGYLGADVDTMTYLEGLLDEMSGRDADKPAAVVVETIQGEDGVNIATYRWLKELQQLCTTHGILLVVDDTQIGCGRTGTFFSFEAADIQPDIIALSKSLSGLALPMSLVLVKPDLLSPNSEPSDLTADQTLACMATRHVLEQYWSDSQLSQQIKYKEAVVRDWLENLVHSYPGSGLSVRGRGLIQGLVSPAGSDIAREITRYCLDSGLVIETSGTYDEVVKILPALTIELELLKKGLNILEQSVAAVMAQTPRQAQILKLVARS